MKRSISGDDDGHHRLKRIKLEEVAACEERREIEEDSECDNGGFVNFDENLLYEIFKHADSKSLAMASCVSKLWNQTANDERLWEMICTRHWSQVGYGSRQLRSVVLTLGGFRRLFSLYLWPLIRPPPPPPATTATAMSHSLSLPTPRLASSFSVKPPPRTTRWGKDEVHLSLGLLSIRYFEKMSMNFAANGK